MGEAGSKTVGIYSTPWLMRLCYNEVKPTIFGDNNFQFLAGPQKIRQVITRPPVSIAYAESLQLNQVTPYR
jgi:hypothetical protein